jgi:hypothetical protein
MFRAGRDSHLLYYSMKTTAIPILFSYTWHCESILVFHKREEKPIEFSFQLLIESPASHHHHQHHIVMCEVNCVKKERREPFVRL